jgi:hypothetical protein
MLTDVQKSHFTHMRRVGQARICSPYMTVYSVISLPKNAVYTLYIYGSSQPYTCAFHAQTHVHDSDCRRVRACMLSGSKLAGARVHALWWYVEYGSDVVGNLQACTCMLSGSKLAGARVHALWWYVVYGSDVVGNLQARARVHALWWYVVNGSDVVGNLQARTVHAVRQETCRHPHGLCAHSHCEFRLRAYDVRDVCKELSVRSCLLGSHADGCHTVNLG